MSRAIVHWDYRASEPVLLRSTYPGTTYQQLAVVCAPQSGRQAPSNTQETFRVYCMMWCSSKLSYSQYDIAWRCDTITVIAWLIHFVKHNSTTSFLIKTYETHVFLYCVLCRGWFSRSADLAPPRSRKHSTMKTSISTWSCQEQALPNRRNPPYGSNESPRLGL